eukprot:CAMPEP_0184863508 /NCGR_PEP_ID=MMETSP0580-20130426/11357_1 /TAXON_ID=1118495 /ORGANISM="Dactyliosolen fragilissimus" /LENGTH=294 /DNA_ID=CAMNT_0027361875 /DNA_START=149 /DNA_END=1033 /DNA_ORIENTATION=+
MTNLSPKSILNSPYQFNPSFQKPVSLKSGIIKVLQTKWRNAQALALLEQAVEDYNAAEIVATANSPAEASASRRLIALPLDERFDPPTGVFSHGHVQTGDKMSLPKEFWSAIQLNQAEVPWLFSVSRISGVTSPRAIFPSSLGKDNNEITNDDPGLDTVVGGAIDFRSPSNYVFLPRWMMRALALKPRDVVTVKLITTVPSGSAVKLRPHTSEFVKIGNHQAVLETELKHYSALTRGCTIPFDYLGKRYYFDVVNLRSAPRGEKVAMAKVQDCDIAAEFIRAKDHIKTSTKSKA